MIQVREPGLTCWQPELPKWQPVPQEQGLAVLAVPQVRQPEQQPPPRHS